MAVLKVKICGITNIDDALASVDMGADVLGFNFYPESKRFIEPAQALKIIDKLPTYIDTAGVFVNATTEYIEEISEQGFLSWIQLHGDETPDFCDTLRYINARTIKAIRIGSKADIEKAEQFYTDAVLFDTYDPAEYGGTGKTFDWSLVGHLNKRVFLAGGITPDNALKAIEVGVYGIDICSGIESEPGKKDHEKMKQLFENIHHFRG